MKKKIILGITILLVVLVSLNLLFNMSPATVSASETIPFDLNGFTDSMELSNTNYLVASNDIYELYLDETTSYFAVKNKITGVIWNSNPTEMDPWQLDMSKNMTTSAIEKQKATIELSYFNDTGSLAMVNNYALSIYHPKSVLYDAGLRTYSVKYIDHGFQIYYDLKTVDIDYLYFPKYLSPEIIELHPQGALLQQIAYTGYDADLDMYVISNYESMSVLVRSKLYDIFYGEGSLEYTREQAIAENALYGYTETSDPISFKVAIQVVLNDQGIDMSVIQDSIVESGNAKLASISLFPHFGTAISEIGGVATSGYLIVPDGSGATISFNNGKYYQQPYSKRLYGEDLALLAHKMPESSQKISIPLYGMVKDNGGFAAIITAGDTQAQINADVSGRVDSYNKIYPTFYFREHEAITLGSGYNTYALDLWTEDRVNTDFTVKYVFLDQADASYVGVAHVYQAYLDSNVGFTSSDTTTSANLTIELLGAYESREFFLGVPYYKSESLTTYDEAKIILEQFASNNITNINVIYSGMLSGGLSSNLANEYKTERVLGSGKDYQSLLDYATSHQITIYPNVRLMVTNDYNKLFDNYRYSSKRVDGSLSLLYTYHLPSKLPLSETPYDNGYNDDYIISPLFLQEIYNAFEADYPGDAVAFDFLGSALGGNYSDTILYKQDSLSIEKSILDQIDMSLLLSSPLGFAMPYADLITDLPMETTAYAILDNQIPLLQLVLSGKVDYTTISLNLNYDRTDEYYFLKAIETGSNLKYTLTYDNSHKLSYTQFNYYFSTQYSNWLDRIESQLSVLNQIRIHEGYLVNHEYLANNVVKVSYSNGVQIIINYNLSDVTLAPNLTVEAMNYLVLGGE
ncbi:MAG: DUF5696 domain-containing protein [Candidatus Izemoplasmatales bacterium]